MTERKQLACPECFSDPGAPCERCNGKGTISVIVPDGGVPDEMQGLISDRIMKSGVPLSIIAAGVFACAVLVIFATVGAMAFWRIVESLP